MGTYLLRRLGGLSLVFYPSPEPRTKESLQLVVYGCENENECARDITTQNGARDARSMTLVSELSVLRKNVRGVNDAKNIQNIHSMMATLTTFVLIHYPLFRAIFQRRVLLNLPTFATIHRRQLTKS